MRKIALTGAHGVGKTTLGYAISEVLNERGVPTELSPELPRIMCDLVGDPEYFRKGRNSLEKQLTLLYGQTQIEYLSSLKEDLQVLVTDRCLADHWAYTQYFYRGDLIVAGLYEILDKLVAQFMQTYDGIFYLPIEFAPIDDGVRESDVSFQKEIARIIETFLEIHNIPYQIIKGSVEARREALMAHVEALVTVRRLS